MEKSISTNGGYLDAAGTPTSALLSEIEYTDAAIGQMVPELKGRGLYESTLVIVTAKHGQNPVDSSRYIPILKAGTSPATLLSNGNMLPYSESTNNPTGIGPTEDDISLLRLNDASQTEKAVALLEENTFQAGIGQISFGPSLRLLFDEPGLPPDGDPRTPDIAVEPNVGVVYSGSTGKLSEHGGFSHDDTDVMLMLSNQPLSRRNHGPGQHQLIPPALAKSNYGIRKESGKVLPRSK